MLDIKCRLCSSTCALISLFGGKSRHNRDMIRKLVEDTIGIKYEKNDFFKYICYACTVQVYNFFVFKHKSTENERALQAHNIQKDEANNSKKIKVLDLTDIILPETDELQNTLGPWLLSKCEEQAMEQSKDVEKIDVSVQCRLKETINKTCQTDSSNFNHDKSVQCLVPSVTKTTQTDQVLTHSSECSVKDCRENSLPTVTPKCCTNCEENCQENECKCHINIKLEPTLKTIENEHKTHRKRKITNTSTRVTNKINDSLKTCNYCSKKFTASRQMTRHVDNECEIAKVTKNKPIVQLVRLENSKKVRLQYPQCFGYLNQRKSEVKSSFRLRSRSTSSIDSFYTLCSDSWTFLRDLKVGKDKSTQTIPFEDEFAFNFLRSKVILKPKPRRGRPVSLEKKLRLSQ